jgi:LAS superfamily LD-carboxypeptidase LdcB
MTSRSNNITVRVLLSALALVLSGSVFCAEHDNPIYGGLPEKQYLTGRFVPSEHKHFTNLRSAGVPSEPWTFLRVEAASALKRLFDDFHAENPGVPFFVRSAARSFNDQKKIWGDKWSGRVLVFGKRLNAAYPDHLDRAREILRFSSMPGTSRHHWGSDFDLNELNNAYYSSGPGKKLYDWLKANAHKYGFFQPYTSGRERGYEEERWHWSYAPLSCVFLKRWNNVYHQSFRGEMLNGLFEGSKAAAGLAVEYANAVSVVCESDVLTGN